MAAASPVQGLQDEATCPICLEYFTDPVTTKCGHNFCRSCISACPEGAAGAALLCPQCRELCPQGDVRANRQLQSMVQLVKQLSVQQETPPAEGLCEEHEEKLKLFCEEHEKLICLVCQLSTDHEQHMVRPVKEAAHKYKNELQDCLKALREELGAVQQRKLKEEEGCRVLRNKLEEERRKLESEFKRLHQTLKENEETLLRRLEEMEKKITSVENGQLAKLSAEMTSLEALITEIERKSEQPAGELLKDIKLTLTRCEEVAPTPAQMKKYKVLVTLDADSAHRTLALSEGARRVTYTEVQLPTLTSPCYAFGKKRLTGSDSAFRQEELTSPCYAFGKKRLTGSGSAFRQEELTRPSYVFGQQGPTGYPNIPPNFLGGRVNISYPIVLGPKTFTAPPCVLGEELFTSGRRYWEVQLLQEGRCGWAAGVAWESVRRYGGDTHTPEGGVWAVEGCQGRYQALTLPLTPLSSRQPPLRLGFYLDCAGGRLSVYNAETLEELHTFTGAHFTSGVRPYLRLSGGADLRLL